MVGGPFRHSSTLSACNGGFRTHSKSSPNHSTRSVGGGRIYEPHSAATRARLERRGPTMRAAIRGGARLESRCASTSGTPLPDAMTTGCWQPFPTWPGRWAHPRKHHEQLPPRARLIAQSWTLVTGSPMATRHHSPSSSRFSRSAACRNCNSLDFTPPGSSP
jgi:hypothetical protein